MVGHDRRDEAIKASIAPWLSVGDAGRAADYYKAAFGAVERYRLEDDAGRLVVAQLVIGAAGFWIQDDPEASPEACAGAARMILTVEDPESVHSRALNAGATEMSPVSEGHGWLIGRLSDPFGHQWEVGRPLTGAETREQS
jgi:PhnB protein